MSGPPDGIAQSCVPLIRAVHGPPAIWHEWRGGSTPCHDGLTGGKLTDSVMPVISDVNLSTGILATWKIRRHFLYWKS